MAVEIFTKSEFESKLPKHNKTGEVLWEHAGVYKGEHTYKLSFDHGHNIKILIRSSIKTDGFSAETGKDSIRAWLIDQNSNVIGSKTQSYVTRTKGWDVRLVNMLRKLATLGNKIKPCPTCQILMGVGEGKGPNKGKFYISCRGKDESGNFANHHFEWIA
jgi:hypothetical protein